MRIGFTGVPPIEKIKELKTKNPNAKWFDLDVPVEGISKSYSLRYLPETSCSIIQSIISNAVAIKPDILLLTTGASKCDSMLFCVPILKELLPASRIILTKNNNTQLYGNPISSSNLALEKKIQLITDNVLNTDPSTDFEQCNPKAGFWGVPPYDFSILRLFPTETHVFGWTRCMENKTPSLLELELYVDKDIPVVFYSQAFCAKNILAKELARKYKGLYVEADGLIDNSTKAKINAFLELRNCY